MTPAKPVNAAVAARIVQARTAAGHKTPDAASIVLGMLPAVYRRHKNGTHRPKPDELRRYAEAFGVSLG